MCADSESFECDGHVRVEGATAGGDGGNPTPNSGDAVFCPA